MKKTQKSHVIVRVSVYLYIFYIFFPSLPRRRYSFSFLFSRAYASGSLKGTKFMCDPFRAFPSANVPRRGAQKRYLNMKRAQQSPVQRVYNNNLSSGSYYRGIAENEFSSHFFHPRTLSSVPGKGHSTHRFLTILYNIVLRPTCVLRKNSTEPRRYIILYNIIIV